jgi:hypothetical protein
MEWSILLKNDIEIVVNEPINWFPNNLRPLLSELNAEIRRVAIKSSLK